MTIHILCDTETTGLLKAAVVPLEQQPKIIELGLIRVEGDKVVSKHNWLINPGETISDEIVKITGIKPEDLHDKPSFKDLLPEIEAVFNGADTFIAHNAQFDVGMVKNELRRAEVIDTFPFPKEIVCTIAEFRHEFGRRMKLIELYERTLGKPLAQTHRALDDIEAVYEILVARNFFQAEA